MQRLVLSLKKGKRLRVSENRKPIIFGPIREEQPRLDEIKEADS
jgi:hypothetical protein